MLLSPIAAAAAVQNKSVAKSKNAQSAVLSLAQNLAQHPAQSAALSLAKNAVQSLAAQNHAHQNLAALSLAHLSLAAHKHASLSATDATLAKEAVTAAVAQTIEMTET